MEDRKIREKEGREIRMPAGCTNPDHFTNSKPSNLIHAMLRITYSQLVINAK